MENIEYTWNINAVRVQDQGTKAQAVVFVDWQKIGTNPEGIQGVYHGSSELSAQSVPDSEFIKFEDLTKEKVVEWISAIVVDSFEDFVNNAIHQEIAAQINPIVDVPLPWEPPPEPDSITKSTPQEEQDIED